MRGSKRSFGSSKTPSSLYSKRNLPKHRSMTPKPLKFDQYIDAIESISPFAARGRVTELTGLRIRAAIPEGRVGELCLIRSPRRTQDLKAEVVGFKDGEVVLMPLGEIQGITMGDDVI